MDYVTFLHCESCSVPLDPRNPNLYLSSCHHISCKNCVKKLPNGVLCHCGKTAGFLPINDQMPENYKLMVTKHTDHMKNLDATLRKLIEQLGAIRKASEFQGRIQMHWDNLLRQKVMAQRKEIQSLREQVSRYQGHPSIKRDAHVANYSLVPFKQDRSLVTPNVAMRSSLPFSNHGANRYQQHQRIPLKTEVTPLPPLNRNVELKTPVNRGLDCAFVPPFPSKKSTPGSSKEKLSMHELLSRPATQLTPGSGSRRLTIPYDESRRSYHSRGSAGEVNVSKRRS